MKAKFLAEYNIVNMNNRSLTVENKKTHQMCFIHRNAFNHLDNAEDYREITKLVTLNGFEKEVVWIEILIWKSF
jgi:hypothetical protein